MKFKYSWSSTPILIIKEVGRTSKTENYEDTEKH